MCGRGRCTLNAHQVAQACGLSPLDASSVPTQHLDRYRPSYNVAPGAYLPVFRLQRSPATSSCVGEAAPAPAPGPVVHCMKWGLVPSFTKKMEKPDHYRMFNARSESVREKASFRRLLPKNRCLVAVEGFYEWKKDGSKKQPYYIHFKDNRPLVFAALYDSWENSEGEVLHTFTILTTRSSSALEWLHGSSLFCLLFLFEI
ncbi:putative peptidase YMR114C [Asparagus officinalis]|uniref:putative peptidase YMR114C n=1 Tax=Asparagus officinalis TaxID=4686 RepID=UPI00098DFF80|nr:putative peptidase YMR114C [Asparagus officinalis]